MGSEIMTKEELQASVDAIPYFYHRIELPHGIVTPGWAPINPAAYRIPEDLTGKTVLDVGAWDGYWTFEAIKRGAYTVTSVDDFSDTVGAVTNADRSGMWETLELCAKSMGFIKHRERPLTYKRQSQSSADILIHCMNADIQDDRDCACLGRADVAFLFGVLYHLKNPMQSLENVREILHKNGTIHIETAILDGCQSAYTNKGYTSDDCCFEFFPGDEYGMNHSNWWVGTLKAWCGLVEAAGFKNIESWKLTDNPKHVSEARGFIRASV